MRGICFLFGHADAPQSILPILEKAIEQQISIGVADFYVGFRGNFDQMAATALRHVKRKHQGVTATLVLPYHPTERPIEPPSGFDGTFYPPLENTPRKLAIVKANQYMVKAADSIICYVCHYGNTRSLLESAVKQEHLAVVNIAVMRTDTVL